MFCNDTHFCCLDWDIDIGVDDCCRDSSRFEIQAGTVISQLGVDSPTPSSTGGAEDCSQAPIPSSVMAGLAVEGGVLGLALAGLAFMGWKTRQLAQRNESLTRANMSVEVKRQELEGIAYQQWLQPGHGATELPQYGHANPLESAEGRQELSPEVPTRAGGTPGFRIWKRESAILLLLIRIPRVIA